MTLYRVAEKSFILAGADWTAGETLRLLEPLDSDASLLVVRDGPPDDYFLFTSRAAIRLLRSVSPGRPLAKALKLEGRQPVPVLSAYQSEEGAPRPAVVVDPSNRNRVIGVLSAPDRLRSPEPAPPALAAGPVPAQPGASTDRAVETRFPRQVAVNEVAVLRLWLSAQIVAGDHTISVSGGSKVTAMVTTPRPGFQVVGGWRGTLTVTDAPETEALEFKLKAVQPGQGVIRVSLYSGGASLGAFDLTSEVVEGAASAGETSAAEPLPAAEAGADPQPDMTLKILKTTIEDQPHYRYVLSYGKPESGAAEQEFEPQPVERDFLAYFRKLFKDVEDALLSEAQTELVRTGKKLFTDLFPPELRRAIWKCKSQGRLSVSIESEEPWVPWELCYLYGVDDNGEPQDGPFLCEAFAVTRWITRLPTKPRLQLGEIALVIPDSDLNSAPAERQYLLGLSGPGHQVKEISPTREGVIAAMRQGADAYGAWHFTCHGHANPDDPDKESLDLDGGDLEPRDIVGSPERLGKAQPLVFLNACQTGAGGIALTGAGGWATAFLSAGKDLFPGGQSGAAAFIGAYWSVDDSAALTFAKTFYDALLNQGAAMGEAVQVARRKAKEDHPADVSYLAYTVYAHPLARAV